MKPKDRIFTRVWKAKEPKGRILTRFWKAMKPKGIIFTQVWKAQIVCKPYQLFNNTTFVDKKNTFLHGSGRP